MFEPTGLQSYLPCGPRLGLIKKKRQCNGKLQGREVKRNFEEALETRMKKGQARLFKSPVGRTEQGEEELEIEQRGGSEFERNWCFFPQSGKILRKKRLGLNLNRCGNMSKATHWVKNFRVKGDKDLLHRGKDIGKRAPL